MAKIDWRLSGHRSYWKGIPKSKERQIICEHCSKRFLESRFTPHPHRQAETIIVVRKAADGKTISERSIPAPKAFKETRAGKALLERLRSHVPKKFKLRGVDSERKKEVRKRNDATTEPHKATPLRTSIMELIRAKQGKKKR